MSTLRESATIGPGMAGTLMTPEEFQTAENWDENYVYELINGVLIVSPPPGEGERGPNGLLDYELRDYQKRHPQGSALDYTLPEQDIRIGNTIRRADRAIWAGLGRIPNVRRDVPTIAIEFVSDSRRDRLRDYEQKRDEYLSVGVREYWVIDRFRRQMTVYRPDGEDFSEQVVAEGQRYATPLLPGFELDLEKLLAEADKLADALDEDDEAASS